MLVLYLSTCCRNLFKSLIFSNKLLKGFLVQEVELRLRVNWVNLVYMRKNGVNNDFCFVVGIIYSTNSSSAVVKRGAWSGVDVLSIRFNRLAGRSVYSLCCCCIGTFLYQPWLLTHAHTQNFLLFCFMLLNFEFHFSRVTALHGCMWNHGLP